ncbi:uncharacterized protein [Drosophila suzukii]|uniref:Uncharacterized protein n=1 Tax=Drosophila suzukii TaxID=28584 RepID=A0ABM4TV12_DROSZ
MLKLAFLFWSYLILLNSQGSLGDSQDNGRSVCLLTDPSNQCGQFCLSKLHPMIDLIPETNIKLSGIQGEQQSTQMKLVVMKFRLEAQRIQLLKSLERLPSIEDLESTLNGTEEKLMEESINSANLQEGFEAMVNRTEEQVMAINLEMKNQHLILQKSLEDRLQIQLDAQLKAVQTKLSDQNKALYDSFKSETEGQLMAVKAEISNQFKLLQNRLEDQSAVFIETNKEAITNEDFIEIKNQLLELQAKLTCYTWHLYAHKPLESECIIPTF